MTKPIVAFHWLRVNGRQQEKNKQTQPEHRQQTMPNQHKQPRRSFKNLLKRGS